MRRVILIAAVCVQFLFACNGNEPNDNSSSLRSFQAPDFADGSILFVRRTSLMLFDAAAGEEKNIADLDSADVTASPDGALVSYVSSLGGDKEDFVSKPELTLLEISSGATTRIGSGLAPTFSPSGDLLAYSQPIGPRRCEGEVCSGNVRVMAGSPGQDAHELLGPGRWVTLGWAGERLMVVDQDDPAEVQLVSPSSGSVSLGVAPPAVWGGSPSGDRILLVSANTAELRGFGDDGLESKSTLVALQGTLGQGAWSPNGDMVAGALIGPPKGGIPETDLVTIATRDVPGGRVTTVPGSSGAAGQVLWSEDGESLVYVKSAPPRGLNLQAITCLRPPEGPCRGQFSWKRGVTLLHLY
jgi:dipeptidyl aminopeptidase/acylaminoacyl peptidase